MLTVKESDVRRIAKEVREAHLRRSGSVKGQCETISMAIALRLAELDAVVTVCRGRFECAQDSHHHVWVQVDSFIVDATADQFGDFDAVVIDANRRLTHYKEESCLLIHPREVLALVEQSKRRQE